MKKLFLWLKPNGKLVFSVEHPICTAHPSAELGQNDKGFYHPVYNYRDEGEFEQTWFVEGVKKYHRTILSYINILLAQGFNIQQVLEPMPSEEQIKQTPGFAIHKIRPPLLMISALKKSILV